LVEFLLKVAAEEEFELELVLEGAAAGAALGAGGGVLEEVEPELPDFASPALFDSAVLELGAVAPAAGSVAFFPPSRKSVTYQPDPFNWNPAAVSWRFNPSLLQAGQVVRRGSASFCRKSCW
jgi:hypothetical protein